MLNVMYTEGQNWALYAERRYVKCRGAQYTLVPGMSLSLVSLWQM